jgi:hypothetical protein
MQENKLISIVTINGIEYIKKEDIAKEMAVSTDRMPFVIIRSYDAGCFCGYLKAMDDTSRKATLLNSIRMHQWFGASLSQLSQEGTPDPSKCRFAMPETEKDIFNVIEKTLCTQKAMENLQAVKSWKI